MRINFYHLKMVFFYSSYLKQVSIVLFRILFLLSQSFIYTDKGKKAIERIEANVFDLNFDFNLLRISQRLPDFTLVSVEPKPDLRDDFI